MMSRIVIIILIYRRHKRMDLICILLQGLKKPQARYPGRAPPVHSLDNAVSPICMDASSDVCDDNAFRPQARTL
jgi:hypothetical protein